MNLSEQFHLPGEYHEACDRLTTLVEQHALRLLDDEYWQEKHIEAIQDHSGQSYTYIRDDNHDNFENTDEYLYSRFKRCIFHRVTHILDAYADEYDAFRFVLGTVEQGSIRGVGWGRLRHELFDNPDSPYVNWGVLEGVVDQLNNHYREHGRFPDSYTDLVSCPEPNGTIPYAPDKGDYHIHNLSIEDAEVVMVLNAPDTLAPDSSADWTEHTIHFSTHTRFHEMLTAGDSMGAPTLHASDHGYTLDVPIEIPKASTESTEDRALAVDLGVKKQATCAPLEHSEGSHEQVAPPEFIDHPSKAKLLRLKANVEGINDRLAQLREQGKAHTERFDHLLAEYRQVRRKERRLREQIQHDVANELVWLAVEQGCSEIVFESLAGLESGSSRGVTAWSISSWARGDLLEKVEYRAELVGIDVETVNPWGTSRHCPRCGEKGKTVRAPNNHEELRHGGHFHCPNCEFEGDRDYVGAVNVGRKHFDKCKMGRATPAAYMAAGNYASFPSRSQSEMRARSAVDAEEQTASVSGVQSTTATQKQEPVSGRQTHCSNQRVLHAAKDGNDTGGLHQNHSRNTGWRCPKRSVTRHVLTSAMGSPRMLPNPTGN